MDAHKKKRAENWSPEEKEVLRDIIAQAAHIIENKSTNTSINMAKTKEWKNITRKLNELTGKGRGESEIKLAWKRMKLAAKANVSAHKRAQTATGGGEKPPSPSAEDLEVMAIAPQDFIITYNDYDSDAMVPSVPVQPSPVPVPIPGTSSEVPQILTVEEPEEPNYVAPEESRAKKINFKKK
ncbi:hypothetical protein JYU34_007715 [Plutella xylostella]|uniref:Regulatory protein zeste n=1 Tax=Plutella xylostella TaxID=51655 RepID=A0ABQ7QR49_PLUXY|nr:hypothetical protein JYU34_007715 [Plutella xylostella]